MLIWPTSLLAQESQGITAPLRRHEPDLARPAQMVNHEKDLVPREVGAATRHVEHLIFRSDLLRHVRPLKERNEWLRGESCIVGATGWSRVNAEREVR